MLNPGQDKQDSLDMYWNQDVWNRINDAVNGVVDSVRTVAKYLKTRSVPGVSQITDDSLNPTTHDIDEGATRPVVAFSAAFSLSKAQVQNELTPNGGIAPTKAATAARALAQVVEFALTQGSGIFVTDESNVGHLKAGIGDEELQKVSVRQLTGLYSGGIIGQVPAENQVPVNLLKSSGTTNGQLWGDNIIDGVIRAQTKLRKAGYSKQLVLFLPEQVWVDAYRGLPTFGAASAPIQSLLPLVEGRLYETDALPIQQGHGHVPTSQVGLLTSLVNDPVVIAVAEEPTTSFTFTDRDNNYNFLVETRLTPVVRDSEGLALILFQDPGQAKGGYGQRNEEERSPPS
jgi:hypothetical protein